MSIIGKSIETESRLVVAREQGKGPLGLVANRYRVSFNVMELDGDGWTL